MKLNKKLLAVAVSATLFCGSVSAEDDKYQQLENKIANLESMLVQLKQQLAKQEQSNKVMPKKQAEKEAAKHSYSFGGYVKATASFSSYSDGDLASGSAGRDFYIPGTVPVGGDGEDVDFDLSAKESRVNFKSSHVLSNGAKLGTFVEMDFLLAPSGNERVSNSYQPRLRHAFFTYNNWLFGQTWSTFMDTGALAESVDFLGASEGVIFARQPIVRYSRGPWQVSLENPETTISPYGGGGRIVSDDNGMPDLVAKYTHKSNWGHVAAAVLLRNLEYDVVGDDQSEFGYGLSVTGKVKMGSRDDFRFNVGSGSGMGRYAALNLANDVVVADDGSLAAIDSVFASVAYRHFWNSKWRSNIVLSRFEVDNDTDYTGFGVSKSSQSAQLNLMYSPMAKVTFGVGLLHAKRELESGVDGELNRLLFSAKYAF